MRLSLVMVFALAAVLGGCSKGDKCERAYHKLLAMEKAMGKGGSDDAFVERAIQKCKDDLKAHPETGDMLDCINDISGTPTVADLDRCTAKAGKGTFSEHENKRVREPALQLNKIGKSAKAAVAATGEFPKGKAGPSPAGDCCATGGKCPADASAWKDPVWQALELELSEPTMYHFSYESDGKTFTALAVGDADCDTKMATFTLTGTIENGVAKTNIVPPPSGTY